MSAPPPSDRRAKAMARHLRAAATQDGVTLSHGQALERVARQHGFRDWNTMAAALQDVTGSDWIVGDRVSGRYLGQSFEAQIRRVQMIRPGWSAIALKFDTPVDVVTSPHFSNLRQHVRGRIGPKGHSAERTSDGRPQLAITLTGWDTPHR